MKEGFFKSTDGVHNIAYRIFYPQNFQDEPKAILQFCHGMAEHSGRYRKFGKFMAENGIIFCICDHLGHGKSVKSSAELGCFGDGNDYRVMANDAAKFTNIMQKNYKNIPYIIGGHSMGSFVVRTYLSLYKDKCDGAIIMGTGMSSLFTKAGVPIASLIMAFKGKNYKSKLLDNLSFGSYNKKIEHINTSSDWLSRDEKQVKLYKDDNLCGFIFSVGGFAQIARMISFVSTKKWAGSLNPNCPILLISGDCDPVGDYGKGVKKLFGLLQENGIKDVTLKLFEGARHEVLNEINSAQVYEYILNFLKNKFLNK